VTTSTNFDSLLVYIIAVGGKPRNAQLLIQAKEVLLGSQVEVVNAITPDDIPEIELAKLVENSTQLHGRQIGAREIAVMLSHRKCYRFFQNSDKKYLLVLEDDVILEKAKIGNLDIFNILDLKVPSVVSLYSPKWSIWKKTDLGLEAKIPPAYAAAYFLNRECAQLALSQKPVGLADWPPWSSKVKFFYRNDFTVSCIQNDSYLEMNRLNDKQVKLKYLLFKKLDSELKKSWQVRYIIIYPLKWKIRKFAKCLLTLKTSDTMIESWF